MKVYLRVVCNNSMGVERPLHALRAVSAGSGEATSGRFVRAVAEFPGIPGFMSGAFYCCIYCNREVGLLPPRNLSRPFDPEQKKQGLSV